ncbi:MAG: penicillin-binding protein 1C [Deltaproteobacteria bacterium]|nr:penicillin-binding protein 1C [Deltaproteobacteria bacterium]
MDLKKLRSRVLKAAAITLAAAVLFYVFMPRPDLLGGVGLSRAVYDRNGSLLRLTLSPDDKYRLFVPLSEISPYLKEATLLYEDRYFYWHPGINPVSLIRGAWQTYLVKSRRIGASTVTMQLARVRYSIDSRTIGGKLLQIFRAVQIERYYSKDEILEAYLNLVPYGRNVEGAGAASEVYFKKNASKLTVHEALTLAIIPQNPAARTPFEDTDLSNAELIEARTALFERWIKAHPEDKDKEGTLKLPMTVSEPSELPFLAPHFVDFVLRKKKGERLVTSLDLGLEKLLDRRLKAYIEKKRRIGIYNASAMLVDFRTMEVVASVGSADFFNDAIEGQVNGTVSYRSPGSALKPFVYALGIDEGLIHPMTMLKDAPLGFHAYNPENFDGEFSGPISAAEALIKSRNVPAVDVANRLSEHRLYNLIKDSGVGRLREENFYGLALVLGGIEVTMEDLVRMYAMLANEGELRELKVIAGVRDAAGEKKKLLSPEAAYLTLDMLKDAPRPDKSDFAAKLAEDSPPVYWKTGTSYAFRDAWSVGVFGPYVLAVWVGNFGGEGNPAFIGRTAAAPLMFDIIDSLKAEENGVAAVYRRIPEGLSKVHVCTVSGQIPSKSCPRTSVTWFVPGVSPIKACEVHREVAIDKKTGLRACNVDEKTTRKEVYEFWPSDLQKIFRQAGLPRRTAPPYMPGCSLDIKASSGLPPKITSPARGVVYNIRAAKDKSEVIALSAVTDADSSTVFWFVNEKYLGNSPKDKPFEWNASPGKYIIRAVDDQGRADTTEVRVEMVR